MVMVVLVVERFRWAVVGGCCSGSINHPLFALSLLLLVGCYNVIQNLGKTPHCYSVSQWMIVWCKRLGTRLEKDD
jgi:hypothetical protein